MFLFKFTSSDEMMKISNLLITIAFFGLAACQSPVKKEEKPALQTYHHAGIGWTITIPKGFSMLSKGRMEANEAKGRNALGADSSKEASADGLQHLVNFQKNQFNQFNATLAKFSGTEIAYDKNQQLVKKMIFDAYSKQQIKIDTSSGKGEFAAKTFHAFFIKIYGPNGSVVMDQALYSALIDGYDLSINMNSNNEIDRTLLLDAFKHSTFAKTEK